MINKKKSILVGIIILVLLAILLIFLRGNEDNWIKDSKGIWIKHGNPASTPLEVKEQQDAISCASELYVFESLRDVNFISQCLGTCGNYAVDFVNVPRIVEDNQIENQCEGYLNGTSHHFIELNNKDGTIVRIV